MSAGGRVGPLRLYLGLHGFTSTGDYPYFNDNGTALNPADDVYGPRRNNDARQVDGVARAAVTLPGRRALGLALLGFGREQGLPGRGAAPTTSARFKTLRTLGYLRYQSQDDLGPGGHLDAQLFGSEGRDELRDLAGGGELGLGGPQLTRTAIRSAGAIVHGSRPLGGWARVAAVLEGRREAQGAARRLAGVAGAEIDLRSSRLDLDVIPSARVEAVSDVIARRDFAGTTTVAPPLTLVQSVVRLGVVRPIVTGRAVDVVFKANLGRYGRVPSFLERYGNGTARLLGNADLRPERGTNADLALWLDRRSDGFGLSGRTVAFGAIVDDLIDWQSSAYGQARPNNLRQARIVGAEQELRLAIGRRLAFVAQGTFLRALDASDDPSTRGRQLAFHPRWSGYVRPEVARVPLPGGLTLAAYGEAQARGETFAEGTNTTRLGRRLLIGCGVTVAWPRRGVRLTASAANLTDSRAADFSDWALPGRSFFAALSFAPVGEGDGGGGGPAASSTRGTDR